MVSLDSIHLSHDIAENIGHIGLSVDNIGQAQKHRGNIGPLAGLSLRKKSKGLVINYAEEATKWEYRRSETNCTPPPLKTG